MTILHFLSRKRRVLKEAELRAGLRRYIIIIIIMSLVLLFL